MDVHAAIYISQNIGHLLQPDIHEEDGSFYAQCFELEGGVTQGDTSDGLYDNMQEALNLYILEPENSNYLALLPDPTSVDMAT